MSFDPRKLAAIGPDDIFTVDEAARALGYRHGQSIKYHYYSSGKLVGTLKGHVLIFSGRQLLDLAGELSASAPKPKRAGAHISPDVDERYEMARHMRKNGKATLSEIAAFMGYATPGGVSRLLRRGEAKAALAHRSRRPRAARR